MLDKKIKLSNGYEIPSIGFGTWQSPDGDVAFSANMTALECGYRHKQHRYHPRRGALLSKDTQDIYPSPEL